MTKRKHKPGRTKFNHKDRSRYVTNSKAYEENYDRIFGKKEETEDKLPESPAEVPTSSENNTQSDVKKYKIGEIYARAGAGAFYNDMEPVYGLHLLCYSEDEEKVWGYYGIEASSMKELGKLVSRLGEPSSDNYNKLLKFRALEEKGNS